MAAVSVKRSIECLLLNVFKIFLVSYEAHMRGWVALI